MKKSILVLAALILFSANANAWGPGRHGGHHKQAAPIHHHAPGPAPVYRQPPMHHHQMVVINHHPPQPHYNTHYVYYGNDYYRPLYRNNLAQAGTILLSTGILALAVSSF